MLAGPLTEFDTSIILQNTPEIGKYPTSLSTHAIRSEWLLPNKQ